MRVQHKQLASGRWHKLDFAQQMANIGSEVGRTIRWREKDNQSYSQLAFCRCLELLDLTLADCKDAARLKELCRLREVLVDYFIYDNSYGSSDKLWQKYFLAFNYAARKKSGSKTALIS